MNRKFGVVFACVVFAINLIDGDAESPENSTFRADWCSWGLENETGSCRPQMVNEPEVWVSKMEVGPRRFPASSTAAKWISQIFVEAEAHFELAHGASDACRRAVASYQLHLRNQTIWAVRMLESSQWPRVGIFAGMMYHLGNYDECLTVSTPTFRGQYCLAEGFYDFADAALNRNSRQSVEWPMEEESAWSAMNMYQQNPNRLNRKKLHWALCVPSSCRSTDLEVSLASRMQPIFQKYGVNITIKVDSARCQVKNEPDYPQGYHNAWIIIYGFLALVVSASIYELWMKNGNDASGDASLPMEVFTSFSLIDNYKKLVNFTPKNEDLLIHFMKVCAMLFVIYGHRFMFAMHFPMFDTERIEIGYKKLKCINLVHMSLVDVFICYSGFLMYNLNYSKIKSKGIDQVVIIICNRWLRLIPTLGVMIMFMSYVLPYSSDGPLWNEVFKEAEYCRSNWLVGLLAMNNILKPDQLCLWVSWFVSVDFQLTVIGSVLLFIIMRNRRLGLYVSGLTFVLCSAITFMIVYYNRYQGLYPVYMGSLAQIRNSKEFIEVYVTLWSRVGPYLMGFLSAVVARTLMDLKYQFSRTHIICGSILSILIGEYSNIYGSVFYEYGRQYSPFENAIYSAIHRSLFMFPFAYIHCMYAVSGLGFFNRFFEPWIFVPMSRLSYCVFLMNTVIQMYHTFSQRTVMPTSLTQNQFRWFTTDIMYSYAAGFLLHLLVEAPFGNIAKLIVRSLTRKLDKLKLENLNGDGCSRKVVKTAESIKTDEFKNEIRHRNGIQLVN